MIDEATVQPDATVPAPPASSHSVLQTLYAAAIVVAAAYFGRDLIVPIVLASLLAFVLAPACRLLGRVGVPRVAAVIVVALLAFATMGGLGLLVGRQAAELAGSLPIYQSTVLNKINALAQGDGLVARLVRGTGLASGTGTSDGTSGSAFAILGEGSSSSLALARTLAQPLLGPLETGSLVLVFMVFILLANEDLKDRLVRLMGRRDLHRTILALHDAAGRLSQYFLFQLGLNAGFGTIVGLCLWLAGLPNPLLWGILAGLMRFVPYVGVFIALAPPLLLSIAVVPDWSLAVVVLALFVGAELAMGQVIEPLVYGHSTGLSPLAIIVATGFWTLLWGPIGLLLATPLTVCLVVIGRHVEALSFLDIVLGDRPPLAPAEIFYQRALEGRAATVAPIARRQIEATSLTDYYDKVALPGLALAQEDLVRDALAFERLEDIHAQIEGLLEALNGRPATSTGEAAAPPTPGILCIPGRGQLDDLAATMAVQALDGAGYPTRYEPNLVLGPASTTDLSGIGICCLSVLEQGSSASGIRYFVRRMQKRLPGATIIVGLWHADRDSPLLELLRNEGGTEHLVLSIGELLALTRALSARSVATDQHGAASGRQSPLQSGVLASPG